jgi:hypothetical protein
MKWPTTIILSFALLALASCEHHREEALDPTLENFFAADGGGTGGKAGQFLDAQAAAGARSDGTLSRYHFDGGRLNSLGEDKLSRMLKDDRAADPMRVYLNLEERDAATGARRTAVLAFLKDAGLADGQVEIVYGQNPENWSRTSRHLVDLKKTETGTQEGQVAPGAPENGDMPAGTSKAPEGGGNSTAGGGSLFKQ